MAGFAFLIIFNQKKSYCLLYKQKIPSTALYSHHFAYPGQPILFDGQSHHSLTVGHPYVAQRYSFR